MSLPWINDGLHAEAGPFKINVHQTLARHSEGRCGWIWSVSTPGYAWTYDEEPTKEAAQKVAEAWVEAQARGLAAAIGLVVIRDNQ